MASIFSWLRRVWSGSRNEPYRDYPVTYASSHPRSHVAQASHTKGATATTSELPVAGVSYPDLGFEVHGILNLHLNTTDNTFTSNPNIGLNPVSGSTTGLGGIISICLNTTDNTWTSNRPIYLDPINEGTPELGAGPTRTSSIAATSSPSIVQRHDHASLRGSVLGIATSVASGSERGQSTRHRGQRSSSAVGRTDRGDSTHRAHDRSAPSTHALSPAPSEAASLPSLSERETFNPGRSERSASTASRKERGDSCRTHGHSPSSADLLSPAAELESTGAHNPYQSRRFDTTFSPPTPPESSAVPYNGPFIKREGSSSSSPSESPLQVNGQPEMEQIASTRAQPASVADSFQTPSKPTRNSTIDSPASMRGAALSTPPMTDSARRRAPFIFGAQVCESSRRTLPPTPTSPTPSHRTINPPVTLAQPNPPTPSQPTFTNATPTTPFRPPIQEDPTLQWTSIRELVNTPLTPSGHRILPKFGPLCPKACGRKLVMRVTGRDNKLGNAGRPFYTCTDRAHGFWSFADLEGEDEERQCDCGENTRMTTRADGARFWKCMEKRAGCSFTS